ncbi:thioesterase II family protein [Nocardia wallacei]|uniref:thioesterase II family protein n=1 Tax=Nocardia wallacei TaxID=480035 RepID=UPI002454E062|nr:alpha/beta fold hydrolase [Nocardia wallacei]
MAHVPGWIRKFHKSRSESAAPLLICPHAGGGASAYRSLSKVCRDDFDVLLFQYPGRQDRATEPAMTSIEAMAGGAFDEFARSPYNRGEPITVFGHSMGALVAFELVRLAEAADVPVRLLAVSAAVPPWRVAEVPPHPTDDEELLDHLSALQGTGEEVMGNRELMRMTLPVLKADYRAFDAYSCADDVVLRTEIHAMGGEDDVVSFGDLYGWQRHTERDLQATMFEGGHFYLYDNFPGIAELLVPEPISASRHE